MKNMHYLTFKKEDENELRLYVNSSKELYIEAGKINDDDPFYSGFISLDKEDTIALIQELQRLLPEIN